MDRWIEGGVPIFKSGVCLSDAVRWKVSHFLDPVSFQWDRHKVFQAFAMPYSSKILAMELPAQREEDFLFWTRSQSGLYTVKYGYAFLQERSGAWMDVQERHHHSHLSFFKFL